MNRPLSHIRASARRPRRGFTLLMALGLIAMVTVAVILSLRAVSTESNIQGHERRAREALFAAEAGLAEGRSVVQAMLAGVPSNYELPKYNNVIERLGAPVDEPGLPHTASGGFEWYEVVPRTPYTLARGTANAAIDPSITANNRELIGPDGTPIDDYPAPTNVSYRVFLVEDDDLSMDGGVDRTTDSNDTVWLVAVGEVESPTGGQPYRTVIRSLVYAGYAGGALNCTYGTKTGCTGDNTTSSGNPVLSGTPPL